MITFEIKVKLMINNWWINRTAAARDLWWGRLTELVREESMKEPPETNIQIIYHDSDTNTEYVSTFVAVTTPCTRAD